MTIRRLFAVLVIAGLALAPVSRPAMAATSSHAAQPAMADEMAPMAMADEMANHMPCCPSKAPVPIDCDKCVFMAACTSIAFIGTSASVVQPLLTACDDIASLRNDSWPDGLGHPPPEPPPRMLV